MALQNANFGPSHVKRLYRPNNDMHLRKSFRQQFCAQMIVLITGRFGNCSREWKHPFFTVIVSFMNNCFILHKAPFSKKVKEIQKWDPFANIKWCSVTFRSFNYLWGMNCFGNVTMFCLSVLVFKTTYTFPYQYNLNFLDKTFRVWIQSSQCLTTTAFQLQLL